jgi:hypothetical protein
MFTRKRRFGNHIRWVDALIDMDIHFSGDW